MMVTGGIKKTVLVTSLGLSIGLMGCGSTDGSEAGGQSAQMAGGMAAANPGSESSLTPACVGVEKQQEPVMAGSPAGGAPSNAGTSAEGNDTSGGTPASAGIAMNDDMDLSGGAPNPADRPAPIMAQGAGCSDGAMCVSGTCVSNEFEGAVSRVVLGSGQITDAGNTLVKLNVPQGATSFILNVNGLGAELGIATKITSPSGKVVFDYNADVIVNRTDATDIAYSLMVPNAPGVDMEAGEWSFLLMSGGKAVDVTVDAIIKTKPAATRTLDLNLYFVGLDDFGSEQAQSDTEFQALVDNVAAAYGAVDITIGARNYIDITGDDADRLGVVDGTDGPNAELFQLFALSAGQTNRAVDIFFVADIKGIDAGFTLVGLSGGTPGPVLAHGSKRSGVAINMANFLEAKEGGDMMQIESARRLTEIIFAHER